MGALSLKGPFRDFKSVKGPFRDFKSVRGPFRDLDSLKGPFRGRVGGWLPRSAKRSADGA